jgi:hypothetical protein
MEGREYMKSATGEELVSFTTNCRDKCSDLGEEKKNKCLTFLFFSWLLSPAFGTSPPLIFWFPNLFRHMVGLLGRVISSLQGLYLHRTTQHRKTRTNIHALTGIRTRDPMYERSMPAPQIARPLYNCFLLNIIICILIPVVNSRRLLQMCIYSSDRRDQKYNIWGDETYQNVTAKTTEIELEG